MIAAQNEKAERQVQDTVWLVKFIYTKKNNLWKDMDTSILPPAMD